MARQVLIDFDFNNVSKITNLPNPSAAQEAATKAYVDSVIEGLNWKDSVRVASTANITVSGPGASIDDISLTNGDRVLLKDQNTLTENGIYVFNGAATPLTRATDASTFIELEQATVTVEEGTANEGTTYRQTEINGTIGVDDILFVSFGTTVASASETVAGKAEIATQGETDTGTDDARIVTPLKLANWSGRKLKFAQTIGDNSATSFNIDHNFGTRDVSVTVYRNSAPYDEIIADYFHDTTNRTIVTFGAAPTTNAFRVVVLG